jgi:deazaflavin-dependent oxidoreductase (nitroreductase family)
MRTIDNAPGAWPLATRLRIVRPFTNRIANPVIRRFAAWLPGFAIIRTVGRRTGRTRRTPLNVFRRDGDYVFALVYGADVDWVRNVLAAGTAQLEQRGRIVTLANPRLSVDRDVGLIPFPMRLFHRAVRVTEFLRMSPT